MKYSPFLLIIMPLLWSCASPPAHTPTNAQTATSTELPGQADDSTATKHETRQDDLGFLYIDLADEDLPRLEFQPYSIVFALNNILAHTGLNTVLEPRYKLALADYLLSGYPPDYTGIYRETAVPDYFQNNDPLVFRQRSLQPGPDAEVTADGILIIQTNLFIDPETGSVDPRGGRFGNLQQNTAFIFLITPDGRLISTRQMKSAAAAPDIGSGDTLPEDTPPADILAAVEVILHTGEDNELEQVPSLLNGLLARDSLEPAQRALVQLNRFLFFLRTDRQNQAVAILEELRADPELTENPAIMRVVESEASGMLEVYRELDAR